MVLNVAIYILSCSNLQILIRLYEYFVQEYSVVLSLSSFNLHNITFIQVSRVIMIYSMIMTIIRENVLRIS